MELHKHFKSRYSFGKWTKEEDEWYAGEPAMWEYDMFLYAKQNLKGIKSLKKEEANKLRNDKIKDDGVKELLEMALAEKEKK